MKNVKLTIQYDGTCFSGWQKQKNQRTVQGELERVLSVLCSQKIEISGTSRTDAGVHACAQVANFKGIFSIPVENIKKAANGLLPRDIAILKAEEAADDFHARFSAIGKKYCYKIENSIDGSVFLKNYCCHVSKELNIHAMREAAANIVGTHDFKAFMSSSGNEPASTVRTVYGIKFNEYNGNKAEIGCGLGSSAKIIEIEVAGNGFLYNMVRIIAGTLIDAGTGKIKPSDIPEIIQSKERKNAGHTAPASGLYLKEIYFEEEELRRKLNDCR